MNKVLAMTMMGLLVTCQPAIADPASDKLNAIPAQYLIPGSVEKAASTITVGARGFVIPEAPLYGGFELATTSVVYILVRGNSLGTLNITQAYLDFPRVALYNAVGTSLINIGGFEGFNACLPGVPTDDPVRSYYAVRGIPVSQDDACLAVQLSAGGYSFRVVPSVAGSTASENSVPPAGEVLFEVKLGP